LDEEWKVNLVLVVGIIFLDEFQVIAYSYGMITLSYDANSLNGITVIRCFILNYGINYAILFTCERKRIYQRPSGVEYRKTTQKIHT
jgi:hypothetical protein